MNEQEPTEVQKPKVSKLAITAVICVAISTLILFLIPWLLPDWIDLIIAPAVFVLHVGLMLGIFALIRIRSSKGGLVGIWRSVIAVLASIIVTASLIDVAPRNSPQRAARILCEHNLRQLFIMSVVYTQQNEGQLPFPDHWCDLLNTDAPDDFNIFICRSSEAELAKSSYAINKNIAGKKLSEIPKDVVLLFEAKNGWNQVGGPELLTTENHEGEGCNISFPDGRVTFFTKEGLDTLRWEP
jgi:hypothetical protein